MGRVAREDFAWTVDYRTKAPAPEAPSKQPDSALVTRLMNEMTLAWRQGQCRLAEELLAEHPELDDRPEAVVRLVYEEICLRKEFGKGVDPKQMLDRFPRWQSQLQALLREHPSLAQDPAGPQFPRVGETWGDFRLLAELGRGAQGRVFLAVQPSLADRPAVLKVAPAGGLEHLALARLQQTHIVPLYSVQYDPGRQLRTLCMPYFGGISLSQILSNLTGKARPRRSGQDLLDALKQAEHAAVIASPRRGPACVFLSRASYVQAITWIGACLADALHYAHERDLVHLDIKPSNVLLAADGQPMLLDFHLAQPPLRRDCPPPERLGGTPDYVSPEQERAFHAVRQGQPVPGDVDGRSDVYSLGVLLYEALGGQLPGNGSPETPPLHRLNFEVSVGLSDLVAKCLARDVRDRYATAAAVADDLRRHLGDLPLAGVANRSFGERWRKWRRRRPHSLVLLGMATLVLLTVGVATVITLGHWRHQRQAAASTLLAVQEQLQQRAYAEAAQRAERGLALVGGVPGSAPLLADLREQRQRALRGHAVQELHRLADRVRFSYGSEAAAAETRRGLAQCCRAAWERRDQLLTDQGGPLDAQDEANLRTDLLDLAILGADLQCRLATQPTTAEAHRQALETLTQAETQFGTSVILDRERQRHAAALGRPDVTQRAGARVDQLQPRTAWEREALGRHRLRAGDWEGAAVEFRRALDRQPHSFWSNFYLGVCAFRQNRPHDALVSFHACVVLAPTTAESYHNRGLALAALGRTEQALRDYDRALELDPALAPAALNRGLLHYQAGRYPQALRDLEDALAKGADDARTQYHLALVHLAQNQRAPALDCLKKSLRQSAQVPEARELWDRLRNEE